MNFCEMIDVLVLVGKLWFNKSEVEIVCMMEVVCFVDLVFDEVIWLMKVGVNEVDIFVVM